MLHKFNNPWDDDKNDNIEDLFKKSQDKFKKMFQQGGGKNSGGGGDDFSKFFTKKYIGIAVASLVGLWLVSGFYTVQPDEEGVVMTFGKYSRTSEPGLNYKLPHPIETVTKISVTRVNKEEIGFRSSGKRITTRQELLQSTVSSESQILTTDENIVDINFEVQWMISDAKSYLFNVYDQGNEKTVKSVAESAMREVIGLTKITDVLAEERSKIEQDAKKLMQQMLDNYGMGVRIMRVQLLRVDPPQDVIDAYRDVQDAKQDKEREINNALSYRNDIVPRARGEGQKIVLDAEAYKQKVIAEALGDSQRFLSIYEQYKNAKDVTRKRMYLETMEEIFSGMDKIIMDKGATGGAVPYLPLSEISKQKSADHQDKKN
jgi:membrane protease subunit HflK